MQVQQQILRIEQQTAQAQARIIAQAKANGTTADPLMLAAVANGGQQKIQQVLAGYNSLMQAQQNPTAGFQGAIATFGEQANDVAGAMKSVWLDAFNGIGQGLANFVETGKLKFDDLTRTILADVVQIEANRFIGGLLASFLPGGGSVSTSTSAVTGGISGLNLPFARGGIFANGIHGYANQIISTPTFFKFASGAGIMGEAGPEAVMPLSRGADGKLGVKSQGGGTVVQIINQGGPQPQVSQSTGPDGQQFIKVIVG